jgi:hypothetical protein
MENEHLGRQVKQVHHLESPKELFLLIGRALALIDAGKVEPDALYQMILGTPQVLFDRFHLFPGGVRFVL